jgi:hypothetical protein
MHTSKSSMYYSTQQEQKLRRSLADCQFPGVVRLHHQHKNATRSPQAMAQSILPDDQPPAKKTKPDGKDAAAKYPRACPRPFGYLVQLLLVALNRSMFPEYMFPDAQASLQIHYTCISLQFESINAPKWHEVKVCT